MVDNVKESGVFPVNSNGEIVLQSGTGDNTVVGYIPSNQIPSDTTTNKMVVKLPSEAATYVYDSSGNVTGLVGAGRAVLSITRVLSGAVRAHINNLVSVVSAGSNTFTHRTYDKTNVALTTPWIELWNGYVPNAGTHGSARELGTGGAITFRAAFVTGISGSAANQAGATVWPCTFYKMASDPAFRAAGGTISTDGKSITVPDTVRVRTDPTPGLSLTAGQGYFTQVELTYVTGANRISGASGITTLGDMRLVTADGSANTVHSTNFTAGTAIGGSTYFPLAVFGYGDPAKGVVGVEGDSIVYGQGDTVGDADGVTGFVKRALNAAGYSFVDVSVPGTDITDMKLYGGYSVRMGLLAQCIAVITDHGHNDRGITSDTFAAGMLPLMQWHNGLLRASIQPGAKIVRTTLCPHTSSTDSFATIANQTHTTTSDTYPSGWRYTYGDYVMRRGAYAGSPFAGLTDPDSGYDLAAAIGMSATDGKWPVTGTANYATADGFRPPLSIWQQQLICSRCYLH